MDYIMNAEAAISVAESYIHCILFHCSVIHLSYRNRLTLCSLNVP